MNLSFKKIATSALAVFFCGTLHFSGTVSAAPSEADLAAFREAMLTPAKPDHRIFREQIIFFMPTLKADLDFQAGTKKKDEIRMAGSLDGVGTDEKGHTTPFHIPFYLDQSQKDMTLYFQFGPAWMKFSTPTVSATAVDIAANPEPEELEQEVAMIKDVKVLKESDTQRTMFVTMDGNKLADWLIENKDKNATEKEKSDPQAEQFFQYILQGLKESDIQYVWSIDKQDWQTIALALNLSGFVQSTAKAALMDPQANLEPATKEILESLAYYSELKAYTTFLEPHDNSLIDIPKEVIKGAQPVGDLFATPKK